MFTQTLPPISKEAAEALRRKRAKVQKRKTAFSTWLAKYHPKVAAN